MTDEQPAPCGDPHPEPRRRPPPMRPTATRQEAPSHPKLAAALLMIGIVAFLILVSVMAVR